MKAEPRLSRVWTTSMLTLTLPVRMEQQARLERGFVESGVDLLSRRPRVQR